MKRGGGAALVKCRAEGQGPMQAQWTARKELAQTDWHKHPDLFATDKINWDGQWLDACKKCQHIGVHNGATCLAAKNGGKKKPRNRGSRW